MDNTRVDDDQLAEPIPTSDGQLAEPGRKSLAAEREASGLTIAIEPQDLAHFKSVSSITG